MERRGVALHMAGVKFDDIAEQVGYADRATAYNAVMRAIRRETAENVEEVRSAEIARLDELLAVLWPKAKGGDLQATDRILRLQERRARYLGLDHADGIAERQVELAERQAELLAGVIRAILDELGLTSKQQEVAPQIVRRHLAAIGTGE